VLAALADEVAAATSGTGSSGAADGVSRPTAS